jgi:hypothetical protein
MKVRLERSGGFAGINKSVFVDTDTLPQNESEQIHNMCDNMNFFNLPSKMETNGNAADLFRYKITVESKSGKHTVETTDLSINPDLENLVNFLSDTAQKK